MLYGVDESVRVPLSENWAIVGPLVAFQPLWLDRNKVTRRQEAKEA